MANAGFKQDKDAKFKALARGIIIAQQREIREMREHLGGSDAGGMHDTSGRHGSQ